MKTYLAGVLAAAVLAGVPALAFAASHHDRWDQHRRYEENHHWSKGDRFDRDDYGHPNVADWKAHHLHKPRRGYEWREVDGRFLEVAIATGLIVAIVEGGH